MIARKNARDKGVKEIWAWKK